MHTHSSGVSTCIYALPPNSLHPTQHPVILADTLFCINAESRLLIRDQVSSLVYT